MTRNPLTVMALAVALAALPGCGSSGGEDASDDRAPRPAAAEPHGKLAAAEYRAARASLVTLAQLEKSGAPPEQAAAGCQKLTSSTELVAAVRALCDDQVRFAGALAGLAQFKQSRCAKAVRAGRADCFARVMRDAARKMRALADTGGRTATALEQRGISGTCALALGLAPRLRAALLRAARDAQRLGRAAVGKSTTAAAKANRRFRIDLGRLRFGSAADSLHQLGSCPHA